MTVAQTLVHALLRLAVVALLLVGYNYAYDQAVTPTPGDADIGKGLLAFMMIMAVAGVWALVDGFLLKPVVWLVAWAVTGIAIGTFWDLLPGIGDGSSSPEPDVFLTMLVLVPALAGGGLGWLVAGRRRLGTA